MILKQFTVSIFLLLSVQLSSINAQESITAAGGRITDNQGTVSYSIGQIFYEFQELTTGSVLPGVLQPYEITAVSSINLPFNLHFTASVYPNPVTDYLILETTWEDLSELYLHLYSGQGTPLHIQSINSLKTTLDMGSYPPAVYYLKVLQNKKEMKTFKVVKNK